MKKILAIAVLTSMVSMAVAQENMMSKRGTPILPEAGDWSIGIDAIPFIDWAFDKSRIMSTSSASSASGAISAQTPMTFVGLYQVDATKAYRARVGINFTSTKQEYNVTINNDTVTASNHTVVDEIKTSNMGITLGGGLQWRRGKGRLHGIYGVEAMIMFNGPTKREYTYGNAFITDTTQPWQDQQEGEANFIVVDSAGNASVMMDGTSRVTESETGGGFGFGIDGFVGVEYFFAPKMSVSAEYNWGIMISSSKEGTTTTESTYNPVTGSQAVAIRTTESNSLVGKRSDFGVRNGDIGTSSTGNVVLHFYF
jgi:hypothetical protein